MMAAPVANPVRAGRCSRSEPVRVERSEAPPRQGGEIGSVESDQHLPIEGELGGAQRIASDGEECCSDTHQGDACNDPPASPPSDDELPEPGQDGRQRGRDHGRGLLPAVGRNRHVVSTAAPLIDPACSRDERDVGCIEREGIDDRAHGDHGGEIEEVLGIGSGEVGNAPQLAFPPEEVVGKLRDVVEADRVDGHRASPIDGLERLDHDVAYRSERHRRIEGRRRGVVIGACPHSAHLEGALLLGHRASGDEYLAPPVQGDLDGKERRRTESVQPQPPAGSDARHSQRPVADDAPAEQWRRREVVEAGGDAQGEISPHGETLRIASVAVPPSERSLFAQVLPTGPAMAADPAAAGEPGDPHSIADVPSGDVVTDRRDPADRLVARHDRQAVRLEVACDELEVGTADAACGDVDE